MIAIIGAGPAGLAAARAIAMAGIEVTVIDAAQKPGGQYWRHRSSVEGYKSNRAEKYFSLVHDNSLVTYINGAQVWSATRSEDVIHINYLQSGVEKTLTCTELILTTGAYDRSLPFTGWDKPGSMTPGAAQALLKGHGVVAGKRIVISGTGPFLLPVAVGLAAGGAKVEGVYEAHSPLRWLRSPLALLLNPEKGLELLYYAKKLVKYSIPIRFGKAVTEFTGHSVRISHVNSDMTIKKSDVKEIQCNVIAAGWGFAPDVSLGGILGCSQKVDTDGTVIFSVDNNQRSSIENIWIAGEATGIGGSDLAIAEGEIAGLSVIGKRIPAPLHFSRFRKKLFARALQVSYPVNPGWKKWVTGETLVCRCEEVSCAQILDSVEELKAEDARTSKLFTRAGMGLCQGRICSRNVAEIIGESKALRVSDSERIAYSNRPIAAPISLGTLGDGITSK
jgi:NADPH-dependent 2,4-dienoyl-CoA reductase/sulfur reductase-like enzyme